MTADSVPRSARGTLEGGPGDHPAAVTQATSRTDRRTSDYLWSMRNNTGPDRRPYCSYAPASGALPRGRHTPTMSNGNAYCTDAKSIARLPLRR